MSLIVTLECESCAERNYTTTKTKKMVQERTKLELKKYCSRERKHTIHKEIK
ncbi:MAG: 50S ribosomal protein L33 [Spirochaetota bacterium]|nr:50S ribosomal protein L33 [Spirochaetota bacterium]